ncbi:MAG: nuclear transport factor 2 family protein [Pyrinomonadaceae bacterium]|nr:nuclear transport factor 2 family protein [Pyrinomonadaceae bacterium]
MHCNNSGITAAALLTVALLFSATAITAQSSSSKSPASRQLLNDIWIMDRELFDTIFNKCDVQRLENLVTEDFEFYHDKSGQVAKSGKEFVDSIRGMCERQSKGTDYRARRVLVPGSMVVYPLNNYGAVQMGVHRFYPLIKGKPIETAKFTHLWKKENGQWRIARVISYDHKDTR